MNEPGAVSTEERSAARPVFVSYATADRKEALSVCQAIERRGPKCWISTRDVEPGGNYQEEIVRAIRRAGAMVLVFSDAANNSDEIKKELSLASRYHVPVMALRIEDVEPSDAFAYELSTRQWIDAFEGWDKSIDMLVRKLEQVSGAEPASPPPHAPARRARTSSLPPRTLIISATVLLVVVGSLVAWFLMRPTGAATHTMQVRLAGFERLSSGLPASMPEAIRDEIIAAFSDDGVIRISTAPAPPAGSTSYALGGTIRSEGDKVRLITRLTNERSGATLWSNDYSYDRKVVSGVPRFVAVEAGSVVRCGLFGASTYRGALPDAVLSDYFQACQGTVRFQDPVRGLDFARKVVAAAPKFSWGWSELAIAAHESRFRAETPPEKEAFRKEGLRAADAAIRLDPTNSEALAFKSALLESADLPAREALLQRAMKARPLSCGCEHLMHGLFLYEVGRIRDAMAQFRRSTEVIALDPDSQFDLAETLIDLGEPGEAKRHFNAGIQLSSDPTTSQQITLWYGTFTRDYRAALEVARDPNLVPDRLRPALITSYEALLSKDPAMRSKAVAQLVAIPPGTSDDFVIPLLGALGANREAINRTEAAAAIGRPAVRLYLFVPSMAGALRDPAFPAGRGAVAAHSILAHVAKEARRLLGR